MGRLLLALDGDKALLICQRLLRCDFALDPCCLERFADLCYDVAKPKKEWPLLVNSLY